MKSLTGKFSSARGWALLLILFLGAGLVVAACGDDEMPTTPAPAPEPPPPAPEPEPEPPAVPTGLRISASGVDFIEWIWTPVADVSGYDVQYSANEAFTDEDEVIARTAEQVTYRRGNLDAETSGYLRVRSAAGTGEDRITSDWSTHVTGMTMAAPVAPGIPTGLVVSGTTESSITWTWNAVEGATAYLVQISMDEMFDDADTTGTTTGTSYTESDLEPETSVYLRVRAAGGSVEMPLLSDWTSHATGTTMAAAPERPPAPANLRVTDRGSDFIEWEWDAVAGADGYQSQFSASSRFGDGQAGRQFHQGMTNTTRRVANLAAESDGYLRVRSWTGTLAEPTFGDWSEADMATTREPPPAVALDAPEGLEADEGETTITLTWDEVDDADSYEVEQREPRGAWSDASCGSATGDNLVDDEECVASGLDEGTDYDFRVRAIPADDDDRHLTGAWSDTLETTTEGTSTTTPPPTTSGGMGNLNVRWTSGGTTPTPTISWTWDRLSGKTYDWAVFTGTDLPRMDAENPCADKAYAQTDVDATNATSTTSPALLCVRTNNPNNNSENLSFAWAVNPPAVPDPPAATGLSPAGTTAMATKSLTWTGIDVAAGFSYEMNVIADPERDNRITDSSPTGSALQRACSAGTLLESDETDVSLTDLETTLRSVKSYTGYLLCLRMLNSSGATDWVVPEDNLEHYTVPAQAPRPTKDSSRSEDDRTATSEKIVWNVATRNDMNVPRGDGTFTDHYELKVVMHPDQWDDDTDQLHDDKVARPTARTCGDDFTANPYLTAPSHSVALTSDGFTVTLATVTRPTDGVRVGGTEQSPTMAILSNIVTLCIQAKHGTRVGPWNISSSETIEKISP